MGGIPLCEGAAGRQLPEGFSGVIQDSASSATLAAVLTMRERALDWQGNKKGLAGQAKLRIYSSDQVHTSIDRAIWVAGIGEENLVRIPVAGRFRAMDTTALEAAIVADREAGLLPAGIIASVGGTSTGGTDDIAAVAAVAKRHGLYLHVDAAWAGSAMICREYRHFWAGVEGADSIVFNPHKWMGVAFDCTAYSGARPAGVAGDRRSDGGHSRRGCRLGGAAPVDEGVAGTDRDRSRDRGNCIHLVALRVVIGLAMPIVRGLVLSDLWFQFQK